MFEVIQFYFSVLGKLFNIYLSWEIFPGVSYLAFLCAAAIMTMLISLVFHNVKEEYDYKMTRYKHDKWNADIRKVKEQKNVSNLMWKKRRR